MASRVALTIGNFDGVHLGHLALVQAARKAVGDSGRVVVLAFDPHPLAVLQPQSAPRRLSTFSQRVQWLRDAGADEVVSIRPTQAFLDQSPQDFLGRIVQQYKPQAIVEGPDFHFGRGRLGSIHTLRELEQAFGYRTIVIEPVEAALSDQSMVRVSSSMVRWLVERGRVLDAQFLLGRPYELHAMVVSGEKRGRTIDMPTINLDEGDRLLPADGVYAGAARTRDGQWFNAAISVGTKPSFGNQPRVCEAHLIGYDGPLDDYGWEARVRFDRWLRDQLTYPNVQSLVDQLKRDVHEASGIRHGAPVPDA